MQNKRTILFALFLVVTVASWSVAPAADGPEDILLFSEAIGINNQGTIAGDHGEIVGVSDTGDIDPVFGPIARGFVIGHTGGMRELRP
jgi:hypothetical protein